MVNKYIKRVLAALIMAVPLFGGAQNIAMNLGGNAGNAAAILDLSDATNSSLGFLLPNVTLTNYLVAAPVTSPPIGLIVFNLNASTSGNGLYGPGIYYWSGNTTGWLYLSNSSTTDSTLSSGSGIISFTYNGSATASISLTNGSASGQVYVTGSSPFAPSLQTMQQDAVIGVTGNVTLQGIEAEPISPTTLVNNDVLAYNTTSNTWVPTNISTLGNYIFNQSTPQAGANFNIGANGVIGGTLNVTGLTTLGALTDTGGASINASGSATTTIGNGTNTLTENGNYTVNGNNGAATTNIGTGSTTGNISIGGTSNSVMLPNFTTNNEVFYTSGGNGTITATNAPASANNVLLYNGSTPVWGALPSGAITASNGLTMSTATNVILGGTLSQATVITQATYSLDIAGGPIGLNDGTSTTATNINTGTSTGGVNIGNGTNTTITENGNENINNSNGAATTNIGTGSTTGNITIGNSNNSILLPAFFQIGDIPYISTTGGALNIIAPTTNASYQVLAQSSTSTTPSWQSLSALGVVTSVTLNAPISGSFNNTSGLLTIGLTSPLALNFGGTGGTATPTPGGVAYGTSTNLYGFTAAGTAGNVLYSNGVNPPTWGASLVSVVSADNGLTFSGTDIQLGGQLIQNTTVSLSGYYLTNDLGNGFSPGTGQFNIQNGGSSNPYLTVVNSGTTGSPVQVGIGTSAPNPAAVLDVTSTTGGVMLPRLTQTQINAITAPAQGLMVYNITTGCVNIYSSGWDTVGCVRSTCGTLPVQPTNLGTTTTFYCGGIGGTETFTLVVPGGSTQTSTVWSISPSGTVGTNSLTSASITIPNTSGSYTITATPFNSNSCSGTPATIIVTVGNTPTVSLPLSESICAGSSVAYTINSNPSGATFSWFGNANSNVSGITTSTQTTGSITDVLAMTSTTVTSPQTVTYSITPSIGSCTGTTSTLTVTVNPVPVITSASTLTVCSGTPETYTITSNVASTYTWSRAAVGFISPSTGSGNTSSISETLTNSSTSPINVTYIITPMATSGGCSGTTFTLTVTVNPSPSLTSATSASICSGGSAAYTITSNPSGTYSWSAIPLPNHITASNSSGTGNIIGTLTNSISSPINVDYTLTLTANGCSSTAIYTVTVNPVPVMSNNSGTACSGTAQTFTITSSINTASYSWTAAPLPSGISGNDNGSGSGNVINETLTSTLGTSTVVVYTITATYGSCSSTATYSVTIAPSTTVTTSTPSYTVCNGGTLTTTAFASSNASTYSWAAPTLTGFTSAPASGSGVAIGNTFSAVVTNTLTTPVIATYTITPFYTGGCAGHTYTISVTVEPTTTVTTATSSYTVCSGNTLTTSTFTSSNANTYSWAAPSITGFSSSPSSGTGIAIGNTFSAVITNTTTAAIVAIYTITPKTTIGGCSGTTFTISVTANVIPTQPGTITATTTTPCPLTSTDQLSITAITGATSYTWSSSNTNVATISGTTTTATITTTSTPTATVTFSVTANNACGSSVPQTINITPVAVPATPGTIALTTPLCAGSTGNAFSVIQVSSYTYSWSFGSTSTSTNTITAGTNTNSITVTAASITVATTYSISVWAVNSCGVKSTSPSTSTFTVNPPSHGTFTGTAGSLTTWVVPSCVTQITVTISGASGGSGYSGNAIAGGLGAVFTTGALTVIPTHTINVMVGTAGTVSSLCGGGGGGSFVWDASNNTTSSTPLVIAGGGGGGGYSNPDGTGNNGSTAITANNWSSTYDNNTQVNTYGGGGGSALSYDGGAGGGGFTGSGANGAEVNGNTIATAGASAIAGGAGGTAGTYGGLGGFGCGGGGGLAGGGGGGFNGGGGGNDDYSTFDGGGGGGGSCINGAAPTGVTFNTAGANGSVTITY